MDAYAVSIDEYIKDGKKITVLQTFPEIDYALLVREAKYEPFVAAYGWDEQNVTWSQGHYFSDILDATRWIQKKLDDKNGRISYDRMCELATNAMHTLKECDDEYAFNDFMHENDVEESEREFFGLTESEDNEDDED